MQTDRYLLKTEIHEMFKYSLNITHKSSSIIRQFKFFLNLQCYRNKRAKCSMLINIMKSETETQTETT